MLKNGLFSLLPLFATAFALAGTQPVNSTSNLKRYSLEELLDLEVVTVSRHESRVFDTPAAISLITQQDLRESGVTAVPEALRMIPGMEVARGVENGGWLISARGLNVVPSTKLLALVDGRSVYNPFSAGVFWDVQDVFLPDIERIEVVRGPGGALWGANAINGIVNVVSKTAYETQGLLFSTRAGSYERAYAGARLGFGIGQQGAARVYMQSMRRDEMSLPSGLNADDPWHTSQGGFRADWDIDHRDTLTLQGDLYDGTRFNPDPVSLFGSNLLGRWQRTSDTGDRITLQTYYDRVERTIPNVVGFKIDTFDTDFQHRLSPHPRHMLTYGGAYRLVYADIERTAVLVAPPSRQTTHLLSAFLQDEISLDDLWTVIGGSKIEHNDFTGIEVQPSLRLLYAPLKEYRFWAALSRAIRTPTLLDDESAIRRGPVVTLGNSAFTSEKVVAYELGMRAQPLSSLTFSIAAFFNDYAALQSIETINATTRQRDNELEGSTDGIELAGLWMPAARVRLRATYSYLNVQLRAQPTSTDTTSARQAGNDPIQQATVRISIDPTSTLELNGTVRFVDRLSNLNVPSYTDLDLRFAWHPTPRLEVALVGQSLLNPSHLEYATPTLQKSVPRGVFATLTWSATER